MRPLLTALAFALVGFAMASNAIEFPEDWGEPPSMGTMDYRALPGGYGHGSSTLASWITRNMENDRAQQNVRYPPSFGRPPLAQTRDRRKLPFGYGFGSGTLARWLADSAAKFHHETKEEFEPFEEE